ncbi:MAG: type I DNA topoisomerase [Candidatus Pacebacteria bacterium]|nr:type I DNA topoisomerase [Candidatus Paceibacterota bacterium]MCF7857269.1 type I DNA topoisomerase [Candidatus Paceibacterota bacterium]
MSQTLVIVESPAKAKTIEKYLGKGYTVRASVGHVRDLPKSNKDAVDIEGGFIPHYIQSSGKEKVIKELRAEAGKADSVLLATDPDREGEAIAWHVAELIKDANKNQKRIVFHEITEPAVNEALKHPRDIDMHLKEAQEARRVLDRLVGYDLSGLIWKKVRYGLSAGRVQSPALRIIMEREREIRAFIPESYFVLSALTKTPSKTDLALTCSIEPREKDEAERIVKIGETHPWEIKNIKETEQKRTPRPPFTTSTLQQVASTRLGFSPSRTMGAAQKLYESGHITYMRTDSTTMSALAQKEILSLLTKEYGKEYVTARTYKTKSKSAQEAHEAVRPSNFSKRSAGMTDDQKKLYTLIWERAVSSQMADAIVKRTKIIANVTECSETIPDFSTNGSRIMFPGWLAVDTRARGEDTEVPKLNTGDKLSLTEMLSEGKETQPPSRYTEAGLIKELEKRGIGRPSTYASIMKTIIDRGYVEKVGKTLTPTDTGDLVSSFLEEHFAKYIGDDFTSEMENELDEIANGTRGYTETLTEFYTPFSAAVAAKEHIDKITNLGAGPEEFPCPTCGSGMVIKLGRGGKFLSCDTYPVCDGARMIDGSQIKDDEPLGRHPETGEDIFLLNGRFGPYVQLGPTPEKIKGKKSITPKRASVPKEKSVADVTLEDAVHYLILPRELGLHPETQEPIIANTGRFGPYIGHVGDFRSLKGDDTPYIISFERALEILKEPKKMRSGEKLLKEVGLHPKTKKMLKVFESKSGRYMKRGFARIWLPDETDVAKFSVEDALALLTKK